MTTFIGKRLVHKHCPNYGSASSYSSEAWLTMWSNIQGESSYSELRIAAAYAAEKEGLDQGMPTK